VQVLEPIDDDVVEMVDFAAHARRPLFSIVNRGPERGKKGPASWLPGVRRYAATCPTVIFRTR
jgi:hypothetical protein